MDFEEDICDLSNTNNDGASLTDPNVQKIREDNDLRNLLASWQLSHLYVTFRDQGITMERLRFLEKHHIEKLFFYIPVGEQAHFEYFFWKWKKPQSNESDTTVNNIERAQNINRLSLKTILDSCPSGLKLKRYYELNDSFNEQHRVILINSIANFVNSNGILYSLADCADLEKQIIKTFPNEKLEYYTNGKRGRLYNKLANLRRSLKEIYVQTGAPNEEEFCSERNAAEVVALMRSDEISAEHFDNLWKQCARYRLIKIKESKSTEEILTDWPEFKKPYGFRFINYDFEIKFPNAGNFITKWGLTNQKLEKFLRTKVSSAFICSTFVNFSNLNEDSRNFFLLWALHHAFPPSTTVVQATSGSKMRKRFTIADSQESFAIVGASILEIETQLKLLKIKGAPIQPRMLIVGDVTNVKETFVYFDELRYMFHSTIKAVDICFKLFYIFNLKYPEASNNFYKFLEAYFYDLGQPKSTKISTTISEIDKF